MNMINERFRKDTLEAWGTYMDALETSINDLEKDIEEAADMSRRCTAEWCTATEHVIDEINDALFNISEPRWAAIAGGGMRLRRSPRTGGGDPGHIAATCLNHSTA